MPSLHGPGALGPLFFLAFAAATRPQALQELGQADGLRPEPPKASPVKAAAPSVEQRLGSLEKHLRDLEREVRASQPAARSVAVQQPSPEVEEEEDDGVSSETNVYIGTGSKDFFAVSAWTPDEIRMVATTTAILLLFFVAFIMCIIYMLNFPDPQVRSLSYKLVSTCIAILCAVLIEQAQFGHFSRFLLMGTLMGDPHSLGHQLKLFALNASVYVFWVAVMSVVMKKNAHNEGNLYAIRLFVAHEVAFVGIHMLAHPQEAWAHRNLDAGYSLFAVQMWQVAFVVAAGLFCLGVSQLARWARQEHRPPPTAVLEEEEEPEEWQNEAGEGEDEAAAILLAYLSRQTLLLFITSRVPTPSGDFGKHTTEHFSKLFFTIFCVLLLLLIASRLLEPWLPTGKKKEHKARSGPERLAEFVVSYFAFLVGWLSLSFCRWIMQTLLREKTLMFVGVAAWVSFPLMLLIVLLDFLTDEGWLRESTALVFIECAGLVIGISWEKAFAMAINTVNHSHSGSTSAFVFTEMGLCIGLCLLLMPGWRWFVCPVASAPVPVRPRHSLKYGLFPVEGASFREVAES